MKIRTKVLAAAPQSRVLRSGDAKGETRHSVDVYLTSEGDMIPSCFTITGIASADEAQNLARRYAPGTVAELTLVPREKTYIDASELVPVTAKA